MCQRGWQAVPVYVKMGGDNRSHKCNAGRLLGSGVMNHPLLCYLVTEQVLDHLQHADIVGRIGSIQQDRMR